MINIQKLLNETQCYETVRELRWADGVQGVSCKSKNVNRSGCKGKDDACQKYVCKELINSQI